MASAGRHSELQALVFDQKYIYSSNLRGLVLHCQLPEIHSLLLKHLHVYSWHLNNFQVSLEREKRQLGTQRQNKNCHLAALEQ